jgi:hypothetical protein
MLPFELRFMRLERAAMALRAEGRNSEISGETISSKIIVLRELLSGESMPRDLHPEAIRSREAEPGTN